MKPEQRAARIKYRAAWLQYQNTFDDAERTRLGVEMDSLQESISPMPDAVWHEFAGSLPGFREFWNSCVERIFAQLKGS